MGCGGWGPAVRDNVVGSRNGVRMDMDHETGRCEDSHDYWQALHASRATPALHASRALHAIIYTWACGVIKDFMKYRGP